MYIHCFNSSSFLNTGYANVVHDREVGFSYINCTGDEGGLEECSVGNLTSHNCTKAGIIHCFNSEY